MNMREWLGSELAMRIPIRQYGSQWKVLSYSGGKLYTVEISDSRPTCTCPDFELRGKPCKHIYAVLATIKRSQEPDGEPKDDPRPEPSSLKPKKPTYRQNWHAYNLAQTHEKWEFMRLLLGLCQTIEQPEYQGGRPRLPLSDMVFCSALKVYSTLSARRSTGDLDTALQKGYISEVPYYTSVLRCIESAELTPIIHRLIGLSAVSLATVETTFGPDSSGFSTSRFDRWFDEKYGRERSQQIWVKAHIMVGVKTNIVTAAVSTDRDANDYPQFEALLNATAERFHIAEVPADKAYLGQTNFKAITAIGATPYIPFKSNSLPRGEQPWDQLFGYFLLRRDEFLQHYHQRSNAETAFSMIKAKFGDALRSKTDTGLVNEALLKILCHNICVVIQEMYELGIQPDFADAKPLGNSRPRLRLVPSN